MFSGLIVLRNCDTSTVSIWDANAQTKPARPVSGPDVQGLSVEILDSLHGELLSSTPFFTTARRALDTGNILFAQLQRAISKAANQRYIDSAVPLGIHRF